MKRNILETFILIFNGLCIIFPFGMAVIFATVYIAGGWEHIIPGHNLEYYFLFPVKHPLISALMLFIIVFSIYAFYRFLLLLNASSAFTALSIFFLSCTIRVTLAFIFKEDIQPFSDFQRVWDMAHGNFSEHVDYYTLFPDYLNFAVFEKYFIKIFGDQYIHIIYFNCIAASFIASVLYFMGKIFFKDEAISVFMGMLYAFMPSNIIYCMVGTPEFLSISANLLGTFFLLKLYEQTGYRQIISAGLGGVFLGIGSSYKSFSIIIIIAFSMSFLTERILLFNIKRYLALLIIMLVFSGYCFSTASILQNTETEFKIELNNSTAYPHFFLIGLNTEGEGQIHNGNLSRKYYSTYLNNGHNAEFAGQYAKEILVEDWTNHPQAIIPHFVKKMIWAFQDDVIPFYYWNAYMDITPDTVTEKFIYKFISEYMSSFSQFYYFFLMFLTAVTCANSIREKINYKQEFIMLICFGYFCLIFFSEAQSRYKCLVMPYVCILSTIVLKHYIKNWNMKNIK